MERRRRKWLGMGRGRKGRTRRNIEGWEGKGDGKGKRRMGRGGMGRGGMGAEGERGYGREGREDSTWISVQGPPSS